MKPTTRRCFLASFGSLWPAAGFFGGWCPASFSGLLIGAGSAGETGKARDAAPEDRFPFQAFYEPYPSGMPSFPKKVFQPSFVHPNGKWVVLPVASGGFETWDWKLGIPLKDIGGTGPLEGLPQPCAHENLSDGCFAADGQAWSRDGKWLAIGGSEPEVRDASLESAASSLDFLWDAECT